MLKVIYLCGKENIGKTEVLFEFAKSLEQKFPSSLLLCENYIGENIVSIISYNNPVKDIKVAFKIYVEGKDKIIIITSQGDWELSRNENLDFFNRCIKQFNIDYENNDAVLWITASRSKGITCECGIKPCSSTYIMKDYIWEYDSNNLFDGQIVDMLDKNMVDLLLKTVLIFN